MEAPHDPEAEASHGEITQLIHRCRDGDPAARGLLFDAVYGDLRRMAAAYMYDERAGHTLPPTGLVNEAFLRMERNDSAVATAENRRHFFGIAAQAMRRILIEHARRYAAARRPSPLDAEPLDESFLQGTEGEPAVLEVLAVDQALDRLRAVNPRQAEVVELRYFAGLEESEVASLLGISRATVTRDWRVARLMLKSFFGSEADTDGA